MLIGETFSGFKVVTGNHLSIYASELSTENVRAFNALICNFLLLTLFQWFLCINEEKGYLFPTWAQKYFADVSTECSSHHQACLQSFFQTQGGNK